VTRPYRLKPENQLAPSHPLHWTRFWPDLQRLHRSRTEARQDLVLWLSSVYAAAVKGRSPRGFCEVKIRLMDLRAWVRDYKPALEHFFVIKERGFYIDEENFEISTLIPKVLPPEELKVLQTTSDTLRYVPPPLPDGTVISKVMLRPGLDRTKLLRSVVERGRPELVHPLSWLLANGPELNFHFAPSGKLKQRDTSVWPISGIETWPSWLREELFGSGIDLDSAYVQFLVQTIEREFKDRPGAMETMFPALLSLLNDKENFRRDLCEHVLKLPYTSENRSLIKRIIMSLANGSKISPSLLTNGAGFSLTAELIVHELPEAGAFELTQIGAQLQKLADQFRNAKRLACVLLLKTAPNRENVRRIFSSYFAWERQARYALWEAIDRHGIMVHDGIDGVPPEYLARTPELVKQLGLRLTS
jgi:hypothetical protein